MKSNYISVNFKTTYRSITIIQFAVVLCGFCKIMYLAMSLKQRNIIVHLFSWTLIFDEVFNLSLSDAYKPKNWHCSRHPIIRRDFRNLEDFHRFAFVGYIPIL